jgi:hypothetical protein
LNTYWVLENIKENNSFYNKLDILLLLSSTYLWKKHHPTFTTNLSVDKLTYELLLNINAIQLWDKVEILPKNKFIDKSVFWASSKLEKLRFVKGPSIIMDHDFLVYRNLEKYFKNIPFFAYEENGEHYYDTSWNKFINNAKHIINRPRPYAINCCFCYYPDSSFVNHYAGLSLELMEFFTKQKVPNSRFLIFAEQLLLKHLLDLNKIKYDTLLNERWNAKEKLYEPNDKGHMTHQDSSLTYRHYWMDKPLIKKNEKGFSLEGEVTILNNILAKSNVDLKYVNNAL